jgi:hypothetical protein
MEERPSREADIVTLLVKKFVVIYKNLEFFTMFTRQALDPVHSNCIQ